MSNKTKITITYSDDSDEEIELSSSGVLTNETTILKSLGLNTYLNTVNLIKSIDALIRANLFKKVEFEVEEES